MPTTGDGDDQVVAAEGVVALVDGRRVTLLDARSGARRWTRTIEDTGVRFHPTAAIADGLLLVPSTSTDWSPYDE